MLRLVWIVSVVLACTKSPDTTHPTVTFVPADAASADAHADANVPLDATVITVTTPGVPAALASCPKTYAIAAAGTCSLANTDKLACSYPDGHCSCVTFRACAGWAGAYEEARKNPKAQWACTPKLRPDGCLGDTPTIGSSCKQNGKECSYARCGGEVLVCRNSAWTIARQIPPPP